MNDARLTQLLDTSVEPMSLKTASRRLGLTRHRVTALVRSGALIAADPPTAISSGPGRRAILFVTAASVAAQRARVLHELGACEPCPVECSAGGSTATLDEVEALRREVARLTHVVSLSLVADAVRADQIRAMLPAVALND